jgi:HK97 family phage portal protein
VVHIKALSTDGLIGLSPVRQARVALGLSANLTTHAEQFFANDARPSGILKAPARMPDEDFKHLRESWELRQRGLHNAHRIAVVAGELEWQPIGMPLDDAQFLQQRKLSATEVARIFRVPPWVIGAEGGDSMTYSNVEMQSLHFVTYSLRPWLVVIEQALSADRDLFAVNQYAEFLLDGLLRADSATRAQVYTAALNPVTGWLSRSEVRRLENLDPEPESNTPSVEQLVTEAMHGNGAGREAGVGG